jgi:uncharacterized RDD family membrane protein YckC
MKYIVAILVCAVIFILYGVLGTAIFGWKHGGGAIPMLLLFAAMAATWRGITKDRSPKQGGEK